MADVEVLYASVVFKNKRQPRAEKQEEVVYDEVKKPNQTVPQTSDTNGLLSEKEAEKRFRWYQKLACCFGSLCGILVMTIIGLSVYFVFLDKSDELEQLRQNQTFLLEQNMNLTQQKQNLTAALHQVEKENQELQKNFTEQIETMKRTWNEQNVSRTQWSIDEYCPKDKNKNNVRQCSSCQRGWIHSQSSCYAVNNAAAADQKTWKEARENCRGKISDLPVVGDETEKTFVDGTSWAGTGIKGYWIGLRAVGKIWKWIDGSDLTNQAWIQRQPETDGQCVTSLQNRGWRLVNCTEWNAWICEKKQEIF